VTDSEAPGRVGAPPNPRRHRRMLAWACGLMGAYFVIELTVGLIIGSGAIISNGFHTFAAASALLVALFAGRISEHSTEARRVPGALRIDAIIALFSGLILFIMTIVVVAFAVMRLRHPVELPPLTMALTAIGGVVVQVISIRLLLTGQKHNLRTRVAPWHFLAMFVGNLFIMIAAGFIWLTGWTPIDQILGLTLGLSLLWAAWATCNNALDILMGGALADSKALREALLSSGGSIGMPGAHSWTLPSTPDIPSAPVPPAPVHVTERSRRENAHTDLDEMLRLQCGFFFTSRNAG